MTDIVQPAPPTTERPHLQWAGSQRTGGISEIAVLSPIRSGIVPGERRTYEERLRFSIANLAKRHREGIPNELDRVSSIHFGRMIVIRPEQYLFLSKLANVQYYGDDGKGDWPPFFSGAGVPQPIDDFELQPPPANAPAAPDLRSWLLTLVEFDGDLKSYMRDIAQFIGREFDRIFENCDAYPGTNDFERFWIWIRTFQIETDLFYAPYRELSVTRIRQLECFKRRFDAFVAKVRSPTGRVVDSMDELFDAFLRENQQYAQGFPTPGGTYPSE